MQLHNISFRITKKQFFHLIWIGCIGQALISLLLNVAYHYIPTGTATMIHFLYPLIVYGELVTFFHERLNLTRIGWLCLALAGLFIFIEKETFSQKGILFAFLSGFTFSVYMINFDKTELRSLHYATATFYITLFASLILIVCIAASRDFFKAVSLKSIFFSALVAFICNVIGKIALQLGICPIGSELASVLGLVEPITSVILGVLIYGDALDLKKVIGCGMILGSVFMIVKQH